MSVDHALLCRDIVIQRFTCDSLAPKWLQCYAVLENRLCIHYVQASYHLNFLTALVTPVALNFAAYAGEMNLLLTIPFSS